MLINFELMAFTSETVRWIRMHVCGCRCFDSIRFNGLNRFVSSIIMRSMTPLLQACLYRRHFGDNNRNGWIFMDVDRIPIWSMFWCRFNWNWFKHHLFIYFHLIKNSMAEFELEAYLNDRMAFDKCNKIYMSMALTEFISNASNDEGKCDPTIYFEMSFLWKFEIKTRGNFVLAQFKAIFGTNHISIFFSFRIRHCVSAIRCGQFTWWTHRWKCFSNVQ